ncbi:MAG TPA: zinc-ribbon domain-containing protein [Gemmatimonadaceae bacterium]|nr:zinc-ribbon domain-containing protein [Gemmatimonadaceae bacterium]
MAGVIACIHCGVQVSTSDSVCPHCGTKLPKPFMGRDPAERFFNIGCAVLLWILVPLAMLYCWLMGVGR